MIILFLQIFILRIRLKIFISNLKVLPHLIHPQIHTFSRFQTRQQYRTNHLRNQRTPQEQTARQVPPPRNDEQRPRAENNQVNREPPYVLLPEC